MGCYAQLQPDTIAAIDGVDMVLGAGEKYNISSRLAQHDSQSKTQVYSCDIQDVHGFHASYSAFDRTRTFLKVQDGCDYNCSFCTIPLARGHSRSDTIAGVLANVEELSRHDVKEIVLTGVNLGDFGKGYDGNRRHNEQFIDLVKALDRQTSIPRYRISSIEPNLLTNDIIEYVASSRAFMPHFHIPLQSGNDKLLADMRRRYKRELYANRVRHIKQLMPHACIGVDVIVGFPGETDEEFETTYRFLHELDIAYLHVFTYSERPHTLAVTMEGVVDPAVRKQRNLRLRDLSDKKLNHFRQYYVGHTRPVLFEKAEHSGQMEGYTDNYLRVTAPYDASMVNQIVNYEIE